jgi:Zn-dependent protease
MKNVTPVKLKFSDVEIGHLWKAWVLVSLAFAISLTVPDFLSINLAINFIIATITVGIGFIAHELAHKVVAQKYRCFAEFRANFFMLIFAIVIAFTGTLFAAPGAVMIFGEIDRKQHGIVALAGPLMNIIIALLFIPLMLLFPYSIIGVVAGYGFRINSWLGLFNLIPFGPFDGKKIMDWSPAVLFTMIMAAAILTFFGGRLLGGF